MFLNFLTFPVPFHPAFIASKNIILFIPDNPSPYVDMDDDQSDTEEIVPFSRLADKLHDLTKTYDLIKGKYRELIHAITVSENETGKSKSSLPNLKEKTAVFKVTADALIKVCLMELRF